MMRLLFGSLLVAGSSGCVLEVPGGDPPGPCDRVACSDNGYCDAGECKCKSGYLGDPYALHGCQATAPNSRCETTCGLNSYCDDDGGCRCGEGFVAVCGTGDCIAEASVCDGVPDCFNEADEAQVVCERAVVQEWFVSDACDDGEDVTWRLWARDRDWVWPGPDEVFVTPGFGVQTSELLECVADELICFGGSVGPLSFGVGVDDTESCDDCCYLCDEGRIEAGRLLCR